MSFAHTCRIGSGKQVAHVIVDDGKDQDDEDDTFVVEDTHTAVQNEVDLVSILHKVLQHANTRPHSD